jgi:hypothetical protein
MAFYYEFVSTNEATLERTDPKYFWEHVIAPRFDTYLGRVFERIAEQAYQWLQPRLRLPVVDRVSSPQARSNSGGSSPRVDLLALRLSGGVSPNPGSLPRTMRRPHCG